MSNTELKDFFPIWNKLTEAQQQRLLTAAELRSAKGGTILHNGSMDCLGLLLIRSGQLRVYTLSSEGREITLYRLFELDTCLFSASCVMPDIQFDVVVEAEKDSDFYILPSCLFKDLMEESAAIANYANQLISSRFSEVMWLMDQIMWKSFDKRLAKFLLEESALEGSPSLKLTHERIANHMGTAREVVTRMLRYFQSEGMVTLTRGAVELTDPARLEQLAE
ncbi:MAG: Crp/Fnr family transcriptional regulator [Oscillospiraceae bacterium]|nr:Crp/Fnr family transcriptional regulator [Oscillospiraceae bacterium]